MVKKKVETWTPNWGDYSKVIAEQNPWHETGLVPDARAFYDRFKRFKDRCFVVSSALTLQMPEPGTMIDIGGIPLDLFLLVVSAQAEKELGNNLLVQSRQA